MITIYSKPDCPQCDQAKHMLELRDIPFEEVLLSDAAAVSHFKAKYPNVRSVPQVVIDEVLIGGKKQLSDWLMN